MVKYRIAQTAPFDYHIEKRSWIPFIWKKIPDSDTTSAYLASIELRELNNPYPRYFYD